VLVMGAGGGIGTAAVQVALGLDTRVVAGVADEDQVATARSAGAPDVVVLDRGSSARIRELTGGRGVDAVLDPLGDWLFDDALRALAPEGRILVIGFAADRSPRSRSTDCCCATWASSGSPSAPSSSWTPLSWASRRAAGPHGRRRRGPPPDRRAVRLRGHPRDPGAAGKGEIPGKGVVVI
jgi:NADPH:quinone reductase-like Zn-dependent oxidoreductase